MFPPSMCCVEWGYWRQRTLIPGAKEESITWSGRFKGTSTRFLHPWQCSANGRSRRASSPAKPIIFGGPATENLTCDSARAATLRIEKNYRTHFVSPALSAQKQERLQARLDQAPVVFQILRGSLCSECGAGLEQDSFLLMEADQSLCLPCAGLGELEFLPSGDPALTRRATKYSGRTAVVVRFSRSRKRYERQGILVELAALEKAEQEGTEDD